jgi:hypothetical protein
MPANITEAQTTDAAHDHGREAHQPARDAAARHQFPGDDVEGGSEQHEAVEAGEHLGGHAQHGQLLVP